MKTLFQEKNKDYSDINLLIIGLIFFYIGIAVFFRRSLDAFAEIISGLLILLAVSLIIIKSVSLIRKDSTRSLIQAAFVFMFFAYFFRISSHFQLLIHGGWLDTKLIGFDTALFGIETSLWMEQFVNPYLTEAMMFGYVFYLPLIVITAFVGFRSAGEKGLSEYLFTLSLAYIFCYIGFILFPAASQMHFMRDSYSVPLEGGLFTYLAELIRQDLHFPGGSLPSPHCAAATVILWVLYKYNRRVFFLMLPSVILLYISTVYGRFHYFLDSATGIITGILAVIIYPSGIRIIGLLKTFFCCVLHPVSAVDSLNE